MSFSNAKDVNVTDNAAQAEKAQSTADSAQATANSAKKGTDDLQNKNIYTPADKRLLKTRVESYKAQYADVLANPYYGQIQYTSVFTDNYNDFMQRAAKVIEDLTTTTVLNDGDYYYLSSDESYLNNYFATIKRELAEAEKKHWDSVNADIDSLDSHATQIEIANNSVRAAADNFAASMNSFATRVDSQMTIANSAANAAYSKALALSSVSVHDYSSELNSVATDVKNAREGVTSLSDVLTTKISNAATVDYVKQTASGLTSYVADTSNSLTAYTDATASGVKQVLTDGINSVSTAFAVQAGALAVTLTGKADKTELKATASELSVSISDKVNTADLTMKANELKQMITDTKSSMYTYTEQTASGLREVINKNSNEITTVNKTAGDIALQLEDKANSLKTIIDANYNGLTASISDKANKADVNLTASGLRQEFTSAFNSTSAATSELRAYTETTASGFTRQIGVYESQAGSMVLSLSYAVSGSISQVYSTWVSQAGSLSASVETTINQTKDSFNATVQGNSYKNMFEINSDGIHLKASKDNPDIKDKKIILDADNIEIKALNGTNIAGMLKTQTITATKIQSGDENLVLDATDGNEHFKLKDFEVQKDGTVSIKKGGISVDNGNYAFSADTTGLHQRIGTEDASDRMDFWIDSHGFHHSKGGDAVGGVWIKDNKISVLTEDSNMKDTGQYDPEGIKHIGEYINPVINIGRVGAGNFIRLTSAFNDPQQAGYMTQIASDHIKLSFYSKDSGSDFSDQSNPVLGKAPVYRTYISNQRITMYHEGDSLSTIRWNLIDLNGTVSANTIKTSKSYMDDGHMYCGNLGINSGHTIFSSDGGKVYFAQNDKGGKSISISAASFDKSSLLSKKNVQTKIDGASALAAITNTDYAAFTYKNDDSQVPQYGPIIDDVNATPLYNLDSRLLGEDGKSISQDNLINLLAAAVKELNRRLSLLQLTAVKD